jgi:hypothetical protein
LPFTAPFPQENISAKLRERRALVKPIVDSRR